MCKEVMEEISLETSVHSFIAHILSWPAPTLSVSLGMTGDGRAAGISTFT